jgi:hypothetical protein
MMVVMYARASAHSITWCHFKLDVLVQHGGKLGSNELAATV